MALVIINTLLKTWLKELSSAKADYLVTGDQPLLNKVGNFYQGVTLTIPSDFLKILQ